MSVADYNTDPNSNTSISGINIAEGCPPSGINNAIRQMMADIKAKADTTDGAIISLNTNTMKISGDQEVGGVKTFTSIPRVNGGIKLNVDSNKVVTLSTDTSNSEVRITTAPSSLTDGAVLILYGKDSSVRPGNFSIRAANGLTYCELLGGADGGLVWDGKAIITDGGDQNIGGSKTFTSTIYAGTNVFVSRGATDKELSFYGGSTNSNGASFYLYGGEGTFNGQFRVRAAKGGTYRDLLGNYNGNLTWNGQTIQTTSDERLKTPLSNVPDDVLDAWGAVGWGQFQFLDAVEEKGADKARQHLGIIAQRVKSVFEERGLDACEYGILCHEERPASEDEEAVDLWMVRYTEALAMEAAYQRRRADRAEARISTLERRLDEMEAVLATLGA